MTGVLLYINRRSGVGHVDRFCEALAGVHARALRVEVYDGTRPRRLCSRCWGADRPRSRAFAGTAVPVTERSEGHPRSGLTGAAGPATLTTERAVSDDRLLPDDSDLHRRCRLNLRDACVRAHQAPDTDRVSPVPALRSSEASAIPAPDHDREAARTRVVHPEVEERGGAIARRREDCARHRALNRGGAAYVLSSVLPADGTPARSAGGAGLVGDGAGNTGNSQCEHGEHRCDKSSHLDACLSVEDREALAPTVSGREAPRQIGRGEYPPFGANGRTTEWVGSSNTRPSDRSVTAWPGWNHSRELRYPHHGYVINRWTGEVLSSVIADVRRGQWEERERRWRGQA